MAYRELKITYGTYVCGAGQDKRLIDGPWFVRDDPENFEFRFTLVITGATLAPSDFTAEVDSARAAFRLPDKELKVELVAGDDPSRTLATIFGAKPTATRTALRIRPKLEQQQDQEGNSGRSAVYEITITGERPADYDAGSLRVGFSYDVNYSTSRIRSLIVRGEYTATASALAKATYDAQIATKVAAVQTALGGDWGSVPTDERITVDKEDHVVQFEQTYKELRTNEAVGVLDHADIVDTELSITVSRPGTAGASGERRLREISAQITVWVNKDTNTSIRTLWDAVVEPHIRAEIRTAAETSTVAVTVLGPEFDLRNNIIRASVQALAVVGSTLISRSEVIETQFIAGRIFREIWPDSPPSDNPGDLAGTEAYLYHGSKVVTRTQIVTERRFGRVRQASIGSVGAVVSARTRNRGSLESIDVSNEFAHLVASSETTELIWLGDPPDQFPVTDVTTRRVFRLIRPLPPAPPTGNKPKPIQAGIIKRRR